MKTKKEIVLLNLRYMMKMNAKIIDEEVIHELPLQGEAKNVKF